MQVRIAYNLGIISRRGKKPDFGQGLPADQLTDWHKLTRRELTYRMENVVTAPERVAKIIDLGGTITAQHSPSRKNDAFICAQHIGLDFDHITSVEDVLNHPIVREYGSIIYFTPSSTPEKPKMRVIILLSEPIFDPNIYKQLVLAMMFLFEGNADPSCKDLCRLFFGCYGTKPILTGKFMTLDTAYGFIEQWEQMGAPGMKRGYSGSTNACAGNEYQQSESRRDDNAPSTLEGQEELERWCNLLRRVNQVGKYYFPFNAGGFHLGRWIAGGEINYNEALTAVKRATDKWPYSWEADLSNVIKKAIRDGEQYPYSVPKISYLDFNLSSNGRKILDFSLPFAGELDFSVSEDGE